MASCCNSVYNAIELTLALMVVFLHCYSLEHSDHTTQMLITGVAGGYIVVLIGALIAAIVRKPLHRHAWVPYCLAGICLFALVGVYSIQYHIDPSAQNTHNKVLDCIREQTGNVQIIKDSKNTYGLIKGCVAIANAFTFLFDLIGMRADADGWSVLKPYDTK